MSTCDVLQSLSQLNGLTVANCPQHAPLACVNRAHETVETPLQVPRRFHNSSSDVDIGCANDPSAGSPTETLLRLLLPLSDKVH